MAFIISGGCCNDASCADVCPVDCIRPHPDDPEFQTAEQLYIDPDTCIGCSACMYACPVAAVHDELSLPQHLAHFVDVNTAYFLERPLSPRFLPSPARATEVTLAARVAVIGTGPSGAYAIEHLCEMPGIKINVFERLPTPFGLVRSGVAPDHPTTKLIGEHFESVLEHPNVTCYFNVAVGTTVTLDELRASHHAVIYAGGAADDRKLGIEGEALPGSHSAREFVSWYNGHPDFTDRSFNLDAHTVVVLGNGNVALDVARILTSSAGALATTDIADHAADALRAGGVREVIIAARRGPAEAACTYTELLELGRLPGVDVRVHRNDFAEPPSRSLPASQRRKLDFFRQLVLSDDLHSPAERRITFRFGLRPVSIAGTSRVEALHLRSSSSTTAPPEIIPTGLVLRAVGYEVAPALGLPYDYDAKTLANSTGRLVDEHTGRVLEGLYCVGWAKRGPSGVIGTNKVCSKETVDALLADLSARRLREPTLSWHAVDEAIRSRAPGASGLSGWRAIDRRERLDGRSTEPPKPRRKLVTFESLADAAGTPDDDTPPESVRTSASATLP
jgi:ferredoxin--NADP+ reductase